MVVILSVKNKIIVAFVSAFDEELLREAFAADFVRMLLFLHCGECFSKPSPLRRSLKFRCTLKNFFRCQLLDWSYLGWTSQFCPIFSNSILSSVSSWSDELKNLHLPFGCINFPLHKFQSFFFYWCCIVGWICVQ